MDLIIASFSLAEYGEVLHYIEVRWLSRGRVLKRCVALRLKIEIFMNQKGKVVLELSDEKWLWNLTLLCDISHHLYVGIQNQQKLISHVFGAATSFEMKLKLFWKQLGNVNLYHFYFPVICLIRRFQQCSRKIAT
jgi:hypothetical protein